MKSKPTTAIVVKAASAQVPAGAPEIDQKIVFMWVAQKSANTQLAYLADYARFAAQVGKPLDQINLEDLLKFDAWLKSLGIEDSSRKRTLSAVKSLFVFAMKNFPAYIPLNPAAGLLVPKPKDSLNERILTEEQVVKLIDAAKDNPRDHLLLRMLYFTGTRIEEVVGLGWRDCNAAAGKDAAAGFLTIYGKRSKTRVVRVEDPLWSDLMKIYKDCAFGRVFIFAGEVPNTHLSKSRGWGIVKAAARRAGLSDRVSPHFLRHSIATHMIDHGASLFDVQIFLGHESAETTKRYIHSRPTISADSFLRRPLSHSDDRA